MHAGEYGKSRVPEYPDFQKQGAGLYDDASDDKFVQKVLSLNTWSRVVSFGGTLLAEKVLVEAPTLFDEIPQVRGIQLQLIICRSFLMDCFTEPV